MKLNNKTPYAVDVLLQTDGFGKKVLVALVKASYQAGKAGQLTASKNQLPIFSETQYFAEPGQSSIKYIPDTNVTKLATDVALIGHAIAPANETHVTELDVSLVVGPVSKTVRVFGDRMWTRSRGLFGKRWFKSKARTFRTMPLRYECAFGGCDDSTGDEAQNVAELRNSIGTGIIAKASKKEQVNLPNIEDPDDLIKSPGDRPKPAGFGFIYPEWLPRQSYAGTFNEQWQTQRIPLLPEDFSPKFFNAAHPDLIVDGFLQGNEQVVVTNVTPSGLLEFKLPGENFSVVVEKNDGSSETLAMNLDTLIIDTDEMTVHLLWRASVDVHESASPVNNVLMTSDHHIEVADASA